MKEATIHGKINLECPICDALHEVELRGRKATTIIKGEKVEYYEKYFYCCNAEEDECEFETGKLVNENMLNARNAYRELHGLLTSDQIVEIREMYGLSQVELSRLLGWGEATISRYESKAIQEEVYDNALREITENPLAALELLHKNRNKFSSHKYFQTRERITRRLVNYGKEYLSRRALEGEYVIYEDASEYNGYTALNIDKLEAAISYIASRVNDLFKVKLMKMLWYADALSYKKNGVAITGLVYCHEKMGALPIGHNKIMALENVLFVEIDSIQYDVAYRFIENKNLVNDSLTKADYEIIDCVIDKFGSYSGRELKEYMHEETAYTKTDMHDIIPFSLANDIRDF